MKLLCTSFFSFFWGYQFFVVFWRILCQFPWLKLIHILRDVFWPRFSKLFEDLDALAGAFWARGKGTGKGTGWRLNHPKHSKFHCKWVDLNLLSVNGFGQLGTPYVLGQLRENGTWAPQWEQVKQWVHSAFELLRLPRLGRAFCSTVHYPPVI